MLNFEKSAFPLIAEAVIRSFYKIVLSQWLPADPPPPSFSSYIPSNELQP
jgi:hypothetical protein